MTAESEINRRIASWLFIYLFILLNLLSRDKKTRVGVKTKRLKAGWDDNYLKDILSSLNIITVWVLLIVTKRMRLP